MASCYDVTTLCHVLVTGDIPCDVFLEGSAALEGFACENYTLAKHEMCSPCAK